MPIISTALRATAIPPIPAARIWSDRYDGCAGALIDLTQAVPGYPPHPMLLQKLAEAAADPANARYGPIDGAPVLRRALAQAMSEHYGTAIGAPDIAITAGGNLAFTMAATVAAGPGEAVMLPAPWYFNHQMALAMHGIDAVPLPCDADGGFLPDVSRAAALLHDRVRAIALISPNNPTGAIYPPSLIDQFYALCRSRGLWLILDETYRDFLPDRPHQLFSNPDWQENFVQLYSFSKAYCVPGHRVGAIAAGGAFRDELLKVLDTMQICPQQAAQAALAWAIPELADWRAGNRGIMDARAETFRTVMQRAPRWKVSAIGGYFAYLEIPADLPDAPTTAETLAATHGLATLPGNFFGPGQQRHLRLAFANVEPEAIQQIPDRLALMQPAD